MTNNLTATLHTLNKTTQAHDLNLKLSQAICDGDAVILIEDGVYQCLAPFSAHNSTNDKPWPQLTKSIYALKDDALTRGIPLTTDGITFVTYGEFVKLSLSHHKVVSWY